jgi:hypothetical protein
MFKMAKNHQDKIKKSNSFYFAKKWSGGGEEVAPQRLYVMPKRVM